VEVRFIGRGNWKKIIHLLQVTDTLYRHFQQYFIYNVAVSFIGGENPDLPLVHFAMCGIQTQNFRLHR
jgi:hypothetical protein